MSVCMPPPRRRCQRHPWLSMELGASRHTFVPRAESSLPKYRSAVLGFHHLAASSAGVAGSDGMPPSPHGLKQRTKSLFTRALRSLTTHSATDSQSACRGRVSWLSTRFCVKGWGVGACPGGLVRSCEGKGG